MPSSRLSLLRAAIRARQLVRISRRFEESSICGYILTIGPKFFMMALVSDRIRFDGFECFRLVDVKKVARHPHAKFVETALRKRGEKRPKAPRVDVSRIEKLLLSAGRAFPLITLHRDEADSDVCWIGRINRIKGGYVVLREIKPDATWEDTLSKYRLAEITRVSFGGDYEEALHLVARDPSEED
jgi:hypothetical protein